MGVIRIRLGSMIEWMIAVAVLAAALGIGAALVRESRRVDTVTPVSTREAIAPEPPGEFPSTAVSVPLLLFADGKTVHVGDNAVVVNDQLGSDSVAGSTSVELWPSGERTTRVYTHAGKHFALLFEPSEHDTDLVVAIYLM